MNEIVLSGEQHALTFPKVTGYERIDQELAFGLSPRFKRILLYAWELRQKHGKTGIFDLAHAHVERGMTDDKEFYSAFSGTIDPSTSTLPQKQEATLDIISTAYTINSIKERVRKILDEYIKYGVTEFTSFINVGQNLPEGGIGALKWMDEIRQEYKDKVKLKLISYPMFGFRDDSPERWKLLEKSIDSGYADGIGTLPERDEAERHIGYKANVQRTVLYGLKNKKPVHIHVDQKNIPEEDGAEKILDVISSIEDIYKNPLMKEYVDEISEQKEPFVWLVHNISSACYDEARFQRLAKRMAKYNIGLIVCPSAAISMKQEAEYESRVHNSIARVIDFLKLGIHVKMGVDNIGDMYLPVTGDPFYEVKLMCDALRMYDKEIVAHVIAGIRLPLELQEMLKRKYK